MEKLKIVFVNGSHVTTDEITLDKIKKKHRR